MKHSLKISYTKEPGSGGIVWCRTVPMQSVSHEEGSSFESAAISAAHNKFANLSYSNLIELTMMNGDALVKPEELEFGQVADIISDGESYRSILTGRERGKNTKLVFGTVRLDLTKILRRQENG